LEIVRTANSFLYIVSPYISFEKNFSSINAFRNAFFNARNRNVAIRIVTRGRDPQAPRDNVLVIQDFLNYHNHIYLVPYLHSKIYCNESVALIPSLNLSISSLFNQNEECGILIEKSNPYETKEFQNILFYVDYLISNR
jgi:hypothetical protein